MHDEARTARLMIVDDTPQNIQVLGTTLRRENYRIYVAQSGTQALEMIEEVLPDLILLDVMMPGLDGFETCRRLKENEKTRHIPIIFLTAKAETDDVVKGFEMGAVDYVTKPFHATELLMRVQTQLQLKATQDSVQRISHERKELVHILCHDLANPLGNIVSLLKMRNFPGSFEDFRELLLSSADNGLNLIKLVREMQALEEHVLNLDSVNLADAVTASMQLLNRQFTDKQLQLEISVATEIQVCAEPVSFVNSVLNNLLTNAIKFSHPGSQIRVTAMPSPPDEVLLQVQDFGVGIPPRLLRDLFDVRKTSSRAGTAGELGTGFGMPLVEKFMRAYGGTIDITSQTEQEAPGAAGTTIQLHLKTTCPRER